MSSERSDSYLMFCMALTPFNADGSIDGDGLRAHLRRLVGARLGVYMGSPGSGEGNVLSVAELRRVYEIGVEVCKGKVPVYANPREPRTAEELIALANEAISAGVDVVALYQLINGHGMIPNEREQEIYWNTVLDAIKHPAAIFINAVHGYRPSVALLKRLTARYHQVIAANVLGTDAEYFQQVRDAIPIGTKMYAHMLRSNIATLSSADGAIGSEGNILPRTVQMLGEGLSTGDMAKIREAAMNVQRFATICREWYPATPRWLKMAMKVLGLGNGVLRLPYVLPPDEDLRRMSSAFASMRLRELEGLA